MFEALLVVSSQWHMKEDGLCQPERLRAGFRARRQASGGSCSLDAKRHQRGERLFSRASRRLDDGVDDEEGKLRTWIEAADLV